MSDLIARLREPCQRIDFNGKHCKQRKDDREWWCLTCLAADALEAAQKQIKLEQQYSEDLVSKGAELEADLHAAQAGIESLRKGRLVKYSGVIEELQAENERLRKIEKAAENLVAAQGKTIDRCWTELEAALTEWGGY